MKNELFGILALLMCLAACSSTPSRTTSFEGKDRGEYVEIVSAELSSWEKKARKKPLRQSQQMIAVIQDTRADIRNIEMATVSDWGRYKARIENSLERIHELDKQKAE